MSSYAASSGPVLRQSTAGPTTRRRAVSRLSARVRAASERIRATVSYSSADDAGTTRHWN